MEVSLEVSLWEELLLEESLPEELLFGISPILPHAVANTETDSNKQTMRYFFVLTVFHPFR